MIAPILAVLLGPLGPLGSIGFFGTLARTLPLTLDEAAASARLETLRRTFAEHTDAQSRAELESLARDAPETIAGGRALVWLGDLALNGGDPTRARDYYRRALPHAGEPHRFAARGLGDAALADGHYAEARRFYDDARVGAAPLLAVELDAKRQMATRARQRWLAAIGACGLILAIVAFFVDRIRRGTAPLAPPVELWYATPLYALFILGCLGRDRDVLHALLLGAPASLTLITLTALASRRSPRRPLAYLPLATLANLALAYVVLYQTQLLDRLGTIPSL